MSHCCEPLGHSCDLFRHANFGSLLPPGHMSFLLTGNPRVSPFTHQVQSSIFLPSITLEGEIRPSFSRIPLWLPLSPLRNHFFLNPLWVITLVLIGSFWLREAGLLFIYSEFPSLRSTYFEVWRAHLCPWCLWLYTLWSGLLHISLCYFASFTWPSIAGGLIFLRSLQPWGGYYSYGHALVLCWGWAVFWSSCIVLGPTDFNLHEVYFKFSITNVWNEHFNCTCWQVLKNLYSCELPPQLRYRTLPLPIKFPCASSQSVLPNPPPPGNHCFLSLKIIFVFSRTYSLNKLGISFSSLWGETFEAGFTESRERWQQTGSRETWVNWSSAYQHCPLEGRAVFMLCKYWCVGCEKRMGCARFCSSVSCLSEQQSGSMVIWAWDSLERFEKLCLSSGNSAQWGRQNTGIQRLKRMGSLGLAGRETCRLEQQKRLREEVSMTWMPAVEREGQDWACWGTEKSLIPLFMSLHWSDLSMALSCSQDKVPKVWLVLYGLQDLAQSSLAINPTSNATIVLWKFHSPSTLNYPHFLESDIHTLFSSRPLELLFSLPAWYNHFCLLPPVPCHCPSNLFISWSCIRFQLGCHIL